MPQSGGRITRGGAGEGTVAFLGYMPTEMSHLGARRARLAARGLIVAAGMALFLSLFLGWTQMTLRQLALLAVTANGSLGRLSLARDAWVAYAGAAPALTAVAVLVIVTAVLNRRPLILPAGIACLAALVFVILQLSDPPSALTGRAGVALPSSGVAAHSTSGAGEPVALVALVLACTGMWAMLAAAHAERRPRRPGAGRRRRQRATGSAEGPSRAAVPAAEPADGSA
jgi:hypothetical protein